MIDLCATLPCDEGFDCVMNNTSEVGYNCYDIDECEIESICEPGFECVNSMGTFSCIEINECLEKPNPCPHGQSCLNSIGSYRLGCKPFQEKKNLNLDFGLTGFSWF